MRILKMGLLLMASLAMVSGAANAATLTLNQPGPTILVEGNFYTAEGDFNTGGIAVNDVYLFETAAPSTMWGLQADNIAPGQSNFGIANLTAMFFDSLGALIGTFVVSDASGNLVGPLGATFTLASSALNGDNGSAVVTGTTLSQGGGYDFQVSATPLPPALILFASGLFGLGWLVRRRKRKAQSSDLLMQPA